RSYESVLDDADAETLFTCLEEECSAGGFDLVRVSADRKELLNGFMGFGEHAYTAARITQGERDFFLPKKKSR
ncbi:MAG: hypothetical protein AAFY70_13860, partial [Bacteroidota bacterium]